MNGSRDPSCPLRTTIDSLHHVSPSSTPSSARDHPANLWYPPAAPVIHNAMLDSPWDELLHYGLLVGAVIQLIAIASIVLLPSQPDNEEEEEAGQTREGAEGERKPASASSNVSRKGKKDKGARKRR